MPLHPTLCPRSRLKVSSISALSNRHTGLEQIALTQSLAAMDDLDDVVAKLKRIGDHVLRPGAMRVSAVGDEATLNVRWSVCGCAVCSVRCAV